MNHKIRLLNSANVWATTEEELRALCRCSFTTAVTIRTSLLNGFAHDEAVHQYRFLNTATMSQLKEGDLESSQEHNVENLSSINTLGYSPITLPEYVTMIKPMENDRCQVGLHPKQVIFSVTGSVHEVGLSYVALLESGIPNIAMEVNLSCPNIPGKPPPAYSEHGLVPYLEELKRRRAISVANNIAIGLKVPPYTYQDQFDGLIQALLTVQESNSRHPIDFITSTNTLGSCLSFSDTGLSGSETFGPGGLGGSAIHALALGNVFKLRKLLDQHLSLSCIEIIGVGGVSSGAGFQRMIAAGARGVAVGTAFGIEGIGVFERIVNEVEALQSDFE